MVVPDEVEDGVHERCLPLVAHDLRADDDVAELAGQLLGEIVARVERERERVGRLVDAEVLALQLATLVGANERESELALLESLGGEDASRELAGRVLVDVLTRPVVHLDLDQRRRSVPVSSEWRLYASTMRCTSLCRTTCLWLKRTNSTPSIAPRISCTWIRPDACSRGRSTCVTSPVTTIFEPKPRRVRNICICSGDVF